jgi:hypothetical protein
MQIKRWYFITSVGLLMAFFSACHFSVSTANLSSLNLGKTKSASPPTANFETTDTIYAVAEVSNASEMLKVKAQVYVVDIPGQKSGPIPGLEVTVDMAGSGQANFNFSPPTAGWPKGKYKVEVLMINSYGDQKDQKTAEFSIS